MTIFTRDQLITSLRAKVPGHPVHALSENASAIADAIRIHDLDMVIAGRHDGRPVTFARGYEIVFGERLSLKRA